MEKIFRQSMLFDFYGELLTKHQKSIYQDFVMNDMSYSELGINYGVTRQGVYDIIKRSDKILESYEEKLRLVEKFLNAKNSIKDISDQMISIIDSVNDDNIKTKLTNIIDKSNEIIENF